MVKFKMEKFQIAASLLVAISVIANTYEAWQDGRKVSFMIFLFLSITILITSSVGMFLYKKHKSDTSVDK